MSPCCIDVLDVCVDRQTSCLPLAYRHTYRPLYLHTVTIKFIQHKCAVCHMQCCTGLRRSRTWLLTPPQKHTHSHTLQAKPTLHCTTHRVLANKPGWQKKRVFLYPQPRCPPHFTTQEAHQCHVDHKEEQHTQREQPCAFSCTRTHTHTQTNNPPV